MPEFEVAPGHYVVDCSRSRLAFVTTHMFGLGKVRGTFDLSSGEIVIADPPTASTATAAADTASFNSGSKARDKQVLSKTYLDAANHPIISFESDAAQQDPDGTWKLHGTVTVRGGGAPVVFTVTNASESGGELTLTATASVDRYAHGITAMKGMTGRYLTLDVEVKAAR